MYLMFEAFTFSVIFFSVLHKYDVDTPCVVGFVGLDTHTQGLVVDRSEAKGPVFPSEVEVSRGTKGAEHSYLASLIKIWSNSLSTICKSPENCCDTVKAALL